MQSVGYAAIMPLYCALHLYSSPLFANTSPGNESRTSGTQPRSQALFSPQVIIPAFSLGYLLPTLLMAWPVSSPALHQWLGALWQGFPLHVSLYQHLFARLTTSSETKARSGGRKPQSQVLTGAYRWAFRVACATQLITYAVILGAKMFLSGTLPLWMKEVSTFSAVFSPGPFHSNNTQTSMADAMHDFFKWDQYVGSAALLAWAIALEMATEGSKMSGKYCLSLGWDILRWTLVAGPAGAVMRLRERQEKITALQSGGSRQH